MTPSYGRISALSVQENAAGCCAVGDTSTPKCSSNQSAFCSAPSSATRSHTPDRTGQRSTPAAICLAMRPEHGARSIVLSIMRSSQDALFRELSDAGSPPHPLHRRRRGPRSVAEASTRARNSAAPSERGFRRRPFASALAAPVGSAGLVPTSSRAARSIRRLGANRCRRTVVWCCRIGRYG